MSDPAVRDGVPADAPALVALAQEVGAEPEGWAEGLNREGIGPYIVHIAFSRAKAVKEAARALRLDPWACSPGGAPIPWS